mmetsp:Transcript_60012/g.123219  ORF Transcript_60012/g.123219 Transcript_60012/m.123219 type:complete len:247 (-) Transcript_60012:225-965(-)
MLSTMTVTDVALRRACQRTNATYLPCSLAGNPSLWIGQLSDYLHFHCNSSSSRATSSCSMSSCDCPSFMRDSLRKCFCACERTWAALRVCTTTAISSAVPGPRPTDCFPVRPRASESSARKRLRPTKKRWCSSLLHGHIFLLLAPLGFAPGSVSFLLLSLSILLLSLSCWELQSSLSSNFLCRVGKSLTPSSPMTSSEQTVCCWSLERERFSSFEISLFLESRSSMRKFDEGDSASLQTPRSGKDP